MNDAEYKAISLDAVDETDPLLIGDRLRFVMDKEVQLAVLFGPNPKQLALDFAEACQKDLYKRGLETMRVVAQGVLDESTNIYHVVVELEIVAALESNGVLPRIETRPDGTQYILSGAVARGAPTFSTTSIVALAVVALALVFESHDLIVWVLKRIDPENAPDYGFEPLNQTRDILIAAGVISIFWFLSKVAR